MFSLSGRWPALLVAIPLFLAASAPHLFGYALTGPVWPPGSTINEHLAFTGPSSGRLQDGFATFNGSATDALILWNQQINLVHLNAIVTGIPGIKGDGQNTAFFSSNVYGMSFGPGTLAITVFFYDGSTMKEADNVFNSTIQWDSYRGPLQYNSKKKQYIIDFHRVALHEFGHTLGLDHPDDYGQVVSAIMNSQISDLDHLVDDDIAGVQSLYKARITSSLNPNSSPVGEAFSYLITANNNPRSFSATGLPAGLSLNTGTGVISGTPTVSGTFRVTITATGQGGNAIALLQATIEPPKLLNLFTLSPQIGDSYTYQVTATSHPISYDATGLPRGLQINKQTGVISGVIMAAGDFDINLTAHTPYGDATGILPLHVARAQILSPLYESIPVGEAFNYSITASITTTSYDAIGLPSGLHINKRTGVISGVPQQAGQSIVTLTAYGSLGDASADLTIVVLPPQITSFPNGPFSQIGTSVTYQITSTSNPFAFEVRNLPPDLYLDSSTGLISGIATLSGTYTVSVIAHTAFGDATGSVKITIYPAYIRGTPVATYFDIYPSCLVFDPPRHRLYALNPGNDGLDVIDTQTLAKIAVLTPNGYMWDGAISPDGSTLYLAGGNAGIVARVNLNTLQSLSDLNLTYPIFPTRIRAGLNGVLYVVSIDNMIYELSASTGSTLGVLSRLVANPLLELSPDLKMLYVADATTNPSLSRYDVSTTNAVLLQKNAQLGNDGRSLVLSHDGQEVCLVAASTNGAIELSARDISVRHGQFKGTPSAESIAYSPDDTAVYQFGSEQNTVDVFDRISFGFRRQITLENPMQTGRVGVDPGNNFLFVYGTDALRAYRLAVDPPPPTAAKSLTNISTRLRVGLNNEVAIGGFIIKGATPKKVLIRALGPTLTRYGLSDTMADPAIDLYTGSGALVTADNNWNLNRDAIVNTGHAPLDEHEAAIVATLPPGSYTAFVRGYGGSSGKTLCEVYDLESQNSKIANISTRGNVGAGDNVMIGGFIVGGDQPTNVIVRALGPTLTDFGVNGALADPTLELRDKNGVLISQNDNWKSTQQEAIQNSGYAPPKDPEAAIVATLQPGSYTAIVRGSNNTTGVALVEVYNLDAN